MTVLLAGLIVFFAVHSISIVNEPWRDRMVARLGLVPWQSLYALAASAGLVLIVWGYGLARQDPVVLYVPPAWLRHLAMLLLVPVFPLLLATYLPGRIQAAVKHPMLVSVKLWAVAHLLANGMLADVLLFGAFLAWAVVDRISLKRRSPSPVPGAPRSGLNDIIAVVVGIGIYVAFVMGTHGWLIGVPVIAR